MFIWTFSKANLKYNRHFGTLSMSISMFTKRNRSCDCYVPCPIPSPTKSTNILDQFSYQHHVDMLGRVLRIFWHFSNFSPWKSWKSHTSLFQIIFGKYSDLSYLKKQLIISADLPDLHKCTDSNNALCEQCIIVKAIYITSYF